jgi:hypothetical protein
VGRGALRPTARAGGGTRPRETPSFQEVASKRKWIDWAGDLAVAPIISGIAPAVGDVMPESMDQRWWPQGAAFAGPFPVRLSLAGSLELKAA